MGVQQSKQVVALEDIWERYLLDGCYDFPFLQSISAVNQSCRRVGKSVLSIRIRRAVERFIPHDRVDIFRANTFLC